MKKTFYSLFLLLLCLILSSWGQKGHRKVSQKMAACLPAELSYLNPAWSAFVAGHASDADYRKSQDTSEGARHYIDIDNYDLFIQTGRIPQTFDSVTGRYGLSWVLEQGILPWATLTAFDSLKNCFQRMDWNRSALFAADLGHYVGDGHQPLHITRDYNGYLSGHINIHSRYETTMIGKYEAQLVYDSLPAGYIADVPGYVFSYLYTNYPFVDSLMTADTYATNVAGNTSSDAYYQALWNKTGGFTKQLMQHASSALASLIYSAWVQAGSPRMYPNGIHDRKQPGSPYMMAAFPDPAVVKLNIPVVIPSGRTQVRLLIYNTMGALVRTVIDEVLPEGCHTIECPVDGFASGLYFCRLTSGTSSVTRRFIVAR